LHPFREKSTSSDDVADPAHELTYPAEDIHYCKSPGFAHHRLHLKVGTPFIVLRNISPAQGLADGTRLVVTHLSRSIIQAKILTGSHVGNVNVFGIPRATWIPTLRTSAFPYKSVNDNFLCVPPSL